MTSMRYLCVCDGGNVRSHALAYHLKWIQKREAIAVGRIHVSKETMYMLTNWADRIILMQPHMIESIPKYFRSKCIVVDVGEDRWGVSIHPELNSIADQAAKWLVSTEDTVIVGDIVE